MPRRYLSPVRDARTSRTRLALLEACEAILMAEPPEELTLPAVARRAGVTKPTAYRHFPDQDALMAGFVAHVRERIGMTHEALAALPPEALPAAARANYRRFEANTRLLSRLMANPAFERARGAGSYDRAGLVLPRWRGRGGASERALRERLGPLYLVVTPASWRWLRQTWGLSEAAAARAAAWAIEALTSALATPPAPPRRTRPRRAAHVEESSR